MNSKMKAFVITIQGNDVSEHAAQVCIESSAAVGNSFTPETFNAITPDKVENMMRYKNLRWNYSWQNVQIDLTSGLTKSPYVTAEPKKRMACALSHYSLWESCLQLNEPILVLEHDALFTNKLDDELFSVKKRGIIGVNDPRGATRRSAVFYEEIVKNVGKIQRIPTIDSDSVPQGLAGNSAYIIQPGAAKKLIDAVDYYGLWPNDALMCRQLFPTMLWVTKKFYTTIQKIESSTTL